MDARESPENLTRLLIAHPGNGTSLRAALAGRSAIRPRPAWPAGPRRPGRPRLLRAPGRDWSDDLGARRGAPPRAPHASRPALPPRELPRDRRAASTWAAPGPSAAHPLAPPMRRRSHNALARSPVPLPELQRRHRNREVRCALSRTAGVTTGPPQSRTAAPHSDRSCFQPRRCRPERA